MLHHEKGEAKCIIVTKGREGHLIAWSTLRIKEGELDADAIDRVTESRKMTANQ